MGRVITVGVAVLDIILSVDGYPAENSKLRAAARRVVRGGNAANTAVVLSRLGHSCAWAGTLADDEAARLIRADLAAHGIGCTGARVHADGATPVSYIIHNRRNASRTVIHYRGLPEYRAADFRRIDLTGLDWCHFEGRNTAETAVMLQDARSRSGARNPTARLSLEVEKPRPGIEDLLPLADLILFAREYALAHGHDSATAFLDAMGSRFPDKPLFCTWGGDGAWARDENGHIHHEPAVPPPTVVDTVGAGDTFNAGVIDACLQGYTVGVALRRASRLAGAKCGHEGFDFPLPALT